MEFVWNFVVVNIADLASCYSDVKGCFGPDYSNIFLALGRILWSAFYKITWAIWCGPSVVWCLLLALSFRHIVSNVKLGSWSFILVWVFFLQSSKPWNFDAYRLKERNHFVLEDLYQGWAIFLAQVAFFSLTQAPNKLHQVILRISDYVGSNLDFELSFPDVWIECNLPASTGSLSDIHTKHLIKEEAEARDRRRHAQLLVNDLEQCTFEIPCGKIHEPAQSYPSLPSRFATNHTWLTSSKTARLQSRFGFRTSHDASTQTDDFICERCFDKKDNIEAVETCLKPIERDVTSEALRLSEAVESETQDNDVGIEDTVEEVEDIATGIHWHISTRGQIEGGQVQDAFTHEEPQPVLEDISTVQILSEITPTEIGVATENTYDTNISVEEPPPRLDYRQEAPHVGYKDIQQDVQSDSQQEILHEEPAPNSVPDIRIDSNAFNTEAPEAMETQEMTEVAQSGGLLDTNYIKLAYKSEASKYVPVFPAVEFGLNGLASQATDNAPVFMQVDREDPQAAETENKLDVDLDGDDDMSLFEDLYSDDRSEDAHLTIGATELNTRLLAALELSEASQQLSREVDNVDDAMVSEAVETAIILNEEMDLESNSTEIEANSPNSPTDVDMGSGSEPDITAMDPQEIQMCENDSEVNTPIFDQYWSRQIEPQQPAEVEMSEISNRPGQFPEPPPSEETNEPDELERDLWSEFFRIEEEEADSDEATEILSPSEDTRLWALPPGFSIPVFSASRFAVAQDDEPNNGNVSNPSYQLNAQNPEDTSNDLESQSAEEPTINREEEIVARPKLVPRSRRARHAEKQPGTQTQEQEYTEDVFVENISDLVEQKVLSLLEYGFGVPGEASDATDALGSIARENQHGVQNQDRTLELSGQVQVGKPHGELETCQGGELPNFSITKVSEDAPDQRQKDNGGSQQNQPSLDVPPMKLGALLLPGGNHGVLGSLLSSAPDVQLQFPQNVFNADAGEGVPTTDIPKTPDRKGKGRADQEDYVPTINIGGLTLPGGNAVQNVSPSTPPQPESCPVQPQPTPTESVSDADANEGGSVALETPRPRSPIDLQKRELERLKKKYAKPGRNSPSIFRTPRWAQAQSSSTPGTPSRIAQEEARSETGTTAGLIFSQSPRPAVKIASPAALIKHLKETGEGEWED